MAGQPNIPGTWDFDLSSVAVLEAGGIAPSTIINKPNTFTAKATLTNSGLLSPVLVGANGTVEYHCERLEDGTRVNLAPVAFTMGASPTSVTSPAYSTSGGAGNLDVGTWMMTAHVHFVAPFIGVVAAFSQMLIEVI